MNDAIGGKNIRNDDHGTVNVDAAIFDADLERLAVERGKDLAVVKLGAVVHGAGFLDRWEGD